MKCLMLILGGAADRPRGSLDGRTPLSVARTPTLDALEEIGKVGRVRTIPGGREPALETAVQTLLGYAPDDLAEGGGPFEATGIGVALGAEDVAYRVSLVTTLEGALVDPTAGHIGTAEAIVLLEALGEALASRRVTLRPGRGHEHVLVAAGRPEVAPTRPPEAVVGKSMEEHLPGGPEGAFLRGLVDLAHAVLSEHEVNRVRVDLGENPADGIWPWSGGRRSALPSFVERVGQESVFLSDHPLPAGVAREAGLEAPSPAEDGPKPDRLLDALGACDLVFAYVSGAAEATLRGDAGAKVRALETLDREILDPLVARLPEIGPHRLLLLADRLTPLGGGPSSDPVPFLLAGEGVSSVRRFPFDEEGAGASDLRVDEGRLLLDYLLARPARPGRS